MVMADTVPKSYIFDAGEHSCNHDGKQFIETQTALTPLTINDL